MLQNIFGKIFNENLFEVSNKDLENVFAHNNSGKHYKIIFFNGFLPEVLKDILFIDTLIGVCTDSLFKFSKVIERTSSQRFYNLTITNQMTLSLI